MLVTHKPKILFIGFGHLAKCLLSTKFKKDNTIHAINSKNITLSINFKKKIKTINLHYDYIFLLIRPNTFQKKGFQFKKYITKKSIVISCMAGINLSSICNILDTKKVVRIMPNVMAQYNKSQTFIFAKNKQFLDKNFYKIINTFGSSHYVTDEDQINIATAVFGSGPAFIALLINSYILSAKKLSKNSKLKDLDLINLFQNVLSTNLNSNDLEIFINSIASKKGTTKAGVDFLKSQDIKKIMYTALDRAYKRAREISIEK